MYIYNIFSFTYTSDFALNMHQTPIFIHVLTKENDKKKKRETFIDSGTKEKL